MQMEKSSESDQDISFKPQSVSDPIIKLTKEVNFNTKPNFPDQKVAREKIP